MKLFIQTAFTAIFSFSIFLRTEAQKLAVIPYVSGITSPIDIKNCGDERLFVGDRTGLIRVVNADGTLRPTPFLDITSKISSSTQDEEGFLGIAFSPNYKTDRKFYVDYTGFISGQLTTFVEEYKVSVADSNIADPSSALTLITQSQPFTNHNGGNLMFGKDGCLYINFGDGGSEGDPDGNGQNKTTFLGKILRIDVSNSSTVQPYVIPFSNPFYNDATPGIKKEIWIYGVRNPWRSSVDKLTGDILIADVGQGKVEEVNFQKVGDAGGENYGWNIVEGDSCYNPSSGCDKTGITMPVYEYFHNGSSAAVTGGYVYRSAQSKSLWGQYIFGDYVFKFIDAFLLNNGAVSGSVHELISPAEATGNPISFGEDRYGDQYVIFNGDGTIYKLEDTSYLRRPKAYFTPIDQGGSYLLQGLQGRNLTYQWLNNNSVISGATSPDYIASVNGNYRLVTTNDLSFSDTSAAFSLGALPLNLISFTAQKTYAGKILLQWKTASEQNIAGYTILRKQNNEPDFSNIGFVKSKSANGSSRIELDYGFMDSFALSNSKLFYKLQIKNTDGSYTYSPIRAITPGINRIINYSLYPNPAKGQVSVYIDDFDQPALMNIYDNTGQKVKEQLLNQQGTNVDISALKGIYIVQFSNAEGSNSIRKKLVVQ